MTWMSWISGCIILILSYYVVRRFKLDGVAKLGLVLKIAAGFGLGLIYKYYYQEGDTFNYFNEAATIAHFFLENPGKIIGIYFDTLHVPGFHDLIVFYNQPRALLFAKIISVFYLFTGGNYWITSACMSIINFLCTYALVNELIKSFNIKKNAVVLAFYFLPTFVFWTSGLLKESLAIGALELAIAVFVRIIRTQNYTQVLNWLILFFSCWLIWELKYFYAAIAIPLMVSLLIYTPISRRFHLHPGYILIIFLFGILIVSKLHYNLSFSRILDVMYENYQLGLQNSNSGNIEYFVFDGNLPGYLLNSPIALFSGLFRPTIFEVRNLFQLIVAIENMAVFFILLAGLWRSRFHFSVKTPIIVVALTYIVLLATMIAFTSPNFGTLSRYKEGYWPFFVLLVLLIFLSKQKRPGTK